MSLIPIDAPSMYSKTSQRKGGPRFRTHEANWLPVLDGLAGAGTLLADFGGRSYVGAMPELRDRLTESLADRYVLEREIGAGGMATVYLARDMKHGRRVALKVLDPDLAAVMGVERFLIEFLRAKDDRFVAGLTYAQLIAVAFMALGAAVMAWRWNVGEGKQGIHAVGA